MTNKQLVRGIPTHVLCAELNRREEIEAEKADAVVARKIAKRKPKYFQYGAGGDERYTNYELYFYFADGSHETIHNNSIERLKEWRVKHFPNLAEEHSPWT